MAGPQSGGEGLVTGAWAVRKRVCVCFIYVYSGRNGMLRAGDVILSFPGSSPLVDCGTHCVSSSFLRRTSQCPRGWGGVESGPPHRGQPAGRMRFLRREEVDDICESS